MELGAQSESVVDVLARTLGSSPDFGKTIVQSPTASFASPSQGGVELLSVLGEGGMAQVHLATQNTLGRHVAVKTLRPGHQSQQMADRLLQEARTTGALEHPNIVPVHDITLARDGSPQIVLKRIEGRSWAQLLSSGSRPLDDHLRILMDVAHAVEFAHHRGFLHRDIKPENVLVGEAGDVYLADWGIAVATQTSAGDSFPLASEVTMIAGTPAYMAPEQLDPVNTPLGPWTDVYLLGSALFEVLAGRPPHEGQSTVELVHNIVRGPTMPDHEPELVRICARAMQGDPEARFESALQFRLALQGYLDHAGARAIANKADDAFALWQKRRDAGEVVEADAALAESRFGYQAALQAWPDFEHAETKLRELDIEMVKVELDTGNLESARRIIRRVTNPPPKLLARVRAAEDEHLNTERRRASLAAATSEATHRGTRAGITAFLAAVWVFGPIYRNTFAEVTPLGIVAPYAASLVLALVVIWVARRGIERSFLNKAVAATVIGMMVTDLALSLMAVRYDLGFLWLTQSLPVVWATGATMAVGLLSPKFWPTAVAMTLLCFAVREWPEWVNPSTSLANFLLFLNAVWVNRSWSELQKRLNTRAGG